MKLLKTASGYRFALTAQDWLGIGVRAGWVKKAQIVPDVATSPLPPSPQGSEYGRGEPDPLLGEPADNMPDVDAPGFSSDHRIQRLEERIELLERKINETGLYLMGEEPGGHSVGLNGGEDF
jgi:hypothetical protein